MICKECGKEMSVLMEEPWKEYYCNICDRTDEVQDDQKRRHKNLRFDL